MRAKRVNWIPGEIQYFKKIFLKLVDAKGNILYTWFGSRNGHNFTSLVQRIK